MKEVRPGLTGFDNNNRRTRARGCPAAQVCTFPRVVWWPKSSISEGSESPRERRVCHRESSPCKRGVNPHPSGLLLTSPEVTNLSRAAGNLAAPAGSGSGSSSLSFSLWEQTIVCNEGRSVLIGRSRRTESLQVGVLSGWSGSKWLKEQVHYRSLHQRDPRSAPDKQKLAAARWRLITHVFISAASFHAVRGGVNPQHPPPDLGGGGGSKAGNQKWVEWVELWSGGRRPR